MGLFRKTVCFGLCLSLIIIGVVSNLPAQAEMIEKAPAAHQVDIQKFQLDNQKSGDVVDLSQMRAGDSSPVLIMLGLVACIVLGAVVIAYSI